MKELKLSPVVFLEDSYQALKPYLTPYQKIAVIGGKIALSKTFDQIEVLLSDKTFTTTIYGKECTFENVERLSLLEDIQSCDCILGVGGGKALDSAKLVAERLNKPIITLPTLASTCAASSAVAVRYTQDHVFVAVETLASSPLVVGIPLQVIAQAPSRYLWAGIGDTLAKPIEIEFCTRHKNLTVHEALSKQISTLCVEQCLIHGAQAMEDAKAFLVSEALTQSAFTILITTGYASSLIDYRYGGSLAHALNNALTHYEEIELHHLHGEVVAFGVLVLLTLDQNIELLNRLIPLFEAIHLPTKLSQLKISTERSELESLLENTVNAPDLDHKPYPMTKDMIYHAILSLEKRN